MSINNYGFNNEGVITSEEIRQILEKYRIGKKPLAKLLGWGETTIIRYMEGDIPTSEYSSKLRTILDNPEYYYDLLMQRKDCLTKVAFKKSKTAVLSKIMASKIHAIAYYFIYKSDEEICASYIQYLLYYCQAFSLALYDKELFQEECIVNDEHLPYPKLYQSMKRCGIHKLDVGDEFITDEERKIIDKVYDIFLWYGPKTIHSLMNYEKSMMKISRDRLNNKILSKDCIRQYFKEACEKYDINDINNIGNYPNRCFEELKVQLSNIS